MSTNNKFVYAFFTFILGLTIGSLGFSSSSADTTNSTVISADSTNAQPIGEVLSICIEKKTGVIRASSSCKKTERATTLSGVGPKGDKGDKGDTGATGAQGERGFTGATGAPGTVAGLRTMSITTWEPSSLLGSCSSFGYSALSPSTNITTFMNSTSLTKSCINFISKQTTIYAP